MAQRKHQLKESLEWIVYDEHGYPVAACRDSALADEIKPEHGYVYGHNDEPPRVFHPDNIEKPDTVESETETETETEPVPDNIVRA